MEVRLRVEAELEVVLPESERFQVFVELLANPGVEELAKGLGTVPF